MSLVVSLYEPLICQHCGERAGKGREVFEANITHNLGSMAEAAGIYVALWRPEEAGLETAGQLVPLLEEGLSKLRADPDHYRQFDSPNGWGTYKHFVPFVERYLEACKAHPEAIVEVSR